MPSTPPSNAPDLYRGATDATVNAVKGAGSNVSFGKYMVTTYDTLSALPAHYNLLFSRACDTSFFLTLPWFSHFARSILKEDDRLRIYAVETAEAPVTARAVLVMHYRNSSTPLLRYKVLAGLGNYYTSLFGVVIDPGLPDAQQVFDALAAAIAGDRMNWNEIDLRPMSTDEPYFSYLVAALRRAGLLVQTYFCFGNWYLDVNKQTYRDYFRGRPSRLINTEKRKRKALETSGRFRFELYSGLENLEEAIVAYNQVYNSSWKVHEPYPDFVGDLIRCCAAQGWLRLGIGYLDDQPAAAQIWIVAGGQASIYKLAYDERFSKLSIGTVLSSMLMEHAIDKDKVEVVDYLTGDDSYKREWMSNRRERWGIRAFNPRTLYGLFAAARHLGGRVIRHAANTIRARRNAKD